MVTLANQWCSARRCILATVVLILAQLKWDDNLSWWQSPLFNIIMVGKMVGVRRGASDRDVGTT